MAKKMKTETDLELAATQNSETGAGVYQSGNNGSYVLFHGIKSTPYKTKAAALRKWSKLVKADLV